MTKEPLRESPAENIYECGRDLAKFWHGRDSFLEVAHRAIPSCQGPRVHKRHRSADGLMKLRPAHCDRLVKVVSVLQRSSFGLSLLNIA